VAPLQSLAAAGTPKINFREIFGQPDFRLLQQYRPSDTVLTSEMLCSSMSCYPDGAEVRGF
jgi:hypothetical protein